MSDQGNKRKLEDEAPEAKKAMRTERIVNPVSEAAMQRFTQARSSAPPSSSLSSMSLDAGSAHASELSERQSRTKTSNGAEGFSSTGDARLDVFFKGTTRGASIAELQQGLAAAWAEHPEHCIALLLQGRDCRGGKGEKLVTRVGMLWLRANRTASYLGNLAEFIERGCLKDLLTMTVEAEKNGLEKLGEVEFIELELFASFLRQDQEALARFEAAKAQAGPEEKVEFPKLSLAGKWAPSEGLFIDRQCGMAQRLANLLFPGEPQAIKLYRKLLAHLRQHLRVVERMASSGQWERINFQACPSKAHKLLAKAFERHQPERYAKYLESVKKGEAKINSTGLTPNELLEKYIRGQKQPDDTTEVQFRALVDRIKSSGSLKSALAVVDVSGSMSGRPMEVAVSLGLVLTELVEAPWTNHVLTFDDNPCWFEVQGSTYAERVHHIMSAPWGGSTNLQKTFDLILEMAVANNVPPADMPRTLFIFSDMNFNAVDRRFAASGSTLHRDCAKKFRDAGYEPMNIVYWNINGSVAPVRADETGAALISGYSAELMTLFLDNPNDLNPMNTLLKALSPYPVYVDSVDRETFGSVKTIDQTVTMPQSNLFGKIKAALSSGGKRRTTAQRKQDKRDHIAKKGTKSEEATDEQPSGRGPARGARGRGRGRR